MVQRGAGMSVDSTLQVDKRIHPATCSNQGSLQIFTVKRKLIFPRIAIYPGQRCLAEASGRSINRLTTITDGSYTPSGSGGGTSTAIATYVYSYDNANRVTTEVNAQGTVTFTYDSGGELLTARGSRTENYTYDSGGNRSGGGYIPSGGNELISGGGYTFTYDKEGNMVSETQLSTGDVWTYGYDDRNRMISAVEKSSGGTILNQATYTYDALDRRIGFDDNSAQTWTVFNGSSADANPYADYNGSGTLLTRYVSGLAVDELFARTSSGGTTAWYLTDRLGSVRDIVNTSGTPIDHIIYDSYGDILSESGGTNGDRFKFAGMEWDSAVQQYYDHARWYGAVTGRFSEQDPNGLSGGDVNLYRYAANSPNDLWDSSGLSFSGGPQGSTVPQDQGAIEIQKLKMMLVQYAIAQMQLEIERSKVMLKYMREMNQLMLLVVQNTALMQKKEELEQAKARLKSMVDQEARIEQMILKQAEAVQKYAQIMLQLQQQLWRMEHPGNPAGNYS